MVRQRLMAASGTSRFIVASNLSSSPGGIGAARRRLFDYHDNAYFRLIAHICVPMRWLRHENNQKDSRLSPRWKCRRRHFAGVSAQTSKSFIGKTTRRSFARLAARRAIGLKARPRSGLRPQKTFILKATSCQNIEIRMRHDQLLA